MMRKIGVVWFTILMVLPSVLFAVDADDKVRQGPLHDYTDSMPSEILLKFKSNMVQRSNKLKLHSQFVATEGQAVAAFAASTRMTHQKKQLSGWYRFKLPPGQTVEAAMADYGNHDLIERAEPNYIVRAAALSTSYTATGAFNDPMYSDGSSGWWLNRTKTDQAYDANYVFQGSSDIVVAVVDTGVDLDHPEFVGRLVGGYNVITPASQPADDNDYRGGKLIQGHGTHVAGTIAAIVNNNSGVAGTAWDARVKVMPVKALDYLASGTIADVADGIIWAAQNGAHIINMSLEVYSWSNPTVLEDACNSATTYGCLLVAAAGNSNRDINTWPRAYPAWYSTTLTVGASTSMDSVTYYSNFSFTNGMLHCVAPGGALEEYAVGWDLDYGVTTTANTDGWSAIDGTSFAAPQAAALAAMLKLQVPGRSNTDVINLILNYCEPYAAENVAYHGAGRINVLGSLGDFKTPTPTSTESATYTTTPTMTMTPSMTLTATISPTATISATYTMTPTHSATYTASPTMTWTPTVTATPTWTATMTPTATPTDTPTFTVTPTNTPTATPSATASITPTFTWTATTSPTATPTFTGTITPTITLTETQTPTPTYTITGTVTPTWTPTDTITLTATHTPTATHSGTATSTMTITVTPTASVTLTITPTDSPTSTVTLTFSPTLTATESVTTTMTPTVTVTPTITLTATESVTPTASASPTPTSTITSTSTWTPTATTSATASFTVTPTMTPTITSTYTWTPTVTPTDSPTVTMTTTPTFTVTSTYTVTLTVTPTMTLTATPTHTVTPTVTQTATETITGTVSMTVTPTWTATPTTTPTITPTRTLTPEMTMTQTLTRTLTITTTQTATVTMRVASDDLSKVVAFPNPWRGDSNMGQERIVFSNLPAWVTLTLYSLDGTIVKTIFPESSSDQGRTNNYGNNGRVEWAMTNEAGQEVSSGIYIYRIVDQYGRYKTGKVAIIR